MKTLYPVILAAIVFASLNLTAREAAAHTPSAVAKAYSEYSVDNVLAYRRFLAHERKEILKAKAIAVRTHKPAAIVSMMQTLADCDLEIFDATTKFLGVEIDEEDEAKWSSLVIGVEGTKADATAQLRELFLSAQKPNPTVQNDLSATQNTERL